eukprot:TRINITY_DN25602_c0_g1_i1.p1 TRINITY_DN25602_c0_g1~~TRINITY_DN25602_c0_g1_i1.p1  ORF type:complete len:474 (+),score=93.59 TRINITY_DN25602_c0_g1_i1:98-1423(+)
MTGNRVFVDSSLSTVRTCCAEHKRVHEEKQEGVKNTISPKNLESEDLAILGPAVACALIPNAVAMHAMQACLVIGSAAAPIPSPLRLLPLPWCAWPLMLLLTFTFYKLGSETPSITTSAAPRLIAAGATLGILEAMAAVLGTLAATTGGGEAAEGCLAVIRCLDVLLSAGLAASACGRRLLRHLDTRQPYKNHFLKALLQTLPVAAGLAAASVFAQRAAFEDIENRVATDAGMAGGMTFPIVAEVGAALCRALRFVAGPLLLRRASAATSLGSLMEVATLSSFFGSLIVLPLSLGLDGDSLYGSSSFQNFDLAAMAPLVAGVFCMAPGETIARIAVLRYANPFTSVALEAGLRPMALILAHILAYDHFTLNGTLALLSLLLVAAVWVAPVLLPMINKELPAQAPVSASQPGFEAVPVLLGRASMLMQRQQKEGVPKKRREV